MSSANNDASAPGNLMGSMMQLEKDLEIFRSLYDEELKLMRLELEELESSKNKLQLNNYNLEVKLKDFIIKFEDIKKTNQELLDELNETKSKCNRVDFELVNSKLELEKVTRENAQYKKDIEDLLNKLNEKQILLDNQIVYSQDIELKLKELNYASAFVQRVNRKEIESLKNKLTVSQESLDKLESKTGGEENNQGSEEVARSFRNSPSQLNRSSSVQDLHSDRKHVQERSDRTNSANMSKELSSGSRVKFEATLTPPDNGRSSQIRAPFEQADRNENQARLQNENLWLKSQNDKLSEQNNFLMNTCKEMEATISNLENALTRIKTQFNSINNSETVTRLTVNTSFEAQPSSNASTRVTGECEKKKPIGPISPFSRGPKSISMPTRASTETSNTASKTSTYTSDNSFQQQQSSTLVSAKNVTKSSNLTASDYTNDLFKNFESATLVEKNYSEPYASTIDNSITEASYTGNVKIHEVNKNGYYIRLLNVSDKIDEDLSNYTIQQMVSTMPVAVFRLPASLKIKPGHTITVWSRTDEVDPQPPHTFVWYEQEKWGTGPECTTILAKPNGQAVSWTTGCHKYGNIDYDELVPVYSHKRNRSSALGSAPTQTQLNRQKLSPKTIYTPTKHPHGLLGAVSDKSTKSMSNLNLWNPGADPTERPESSAIKSNYFREYKAAQSNRSKVSSAVTIRGTFSGSTGGRPQTCIGTHSSRNVNFLPRASSSSHKPKGAMNETTTEDDDYIYQANYMYQSEN